MANWRMNFEPGLVDQISTCLSQGDQVTNLDQSVDFARGLLSKQELQKLYL